VQLVADRSLQPLGIGVRHFALLTFVTHESAGEADANHEALTGRSPSGGAVLSQQAIGDALRIDRTTMVALVDDLEQRGLVRRERNPADRRAYVIRLTSEGADLQRRAEESLNGEAEKFFRPLSENERVALRDSLGRLVEHSRGLL
jgi:DNA-binding MarR family transcriptional regulator